MEKGAFLNPDSNSDDFIDFLKLFIYYSKTSNKVDHINRSAYVRKFSLCTPYCIESARNIGEFTCPPACLYVCPFHLCTHPAFFSYFVHTKAHNLWPVFVYAKSFWTLFLATIHVRFRFCSRKCNFSFGLTIFAFSKLFFHFHSYSHFCCYNIEFCCFFVRIVVFNEYICVQLFKYRTN